MSAQNVRVFCRFRPMNAREADEKSHIKFVNTTTLQVPSGGKGEPHKFMFDRVFPPTSTQEETFSHTAEPLVAEIMNGYNCTVFAYGQTGSGKTHTMMGQAEPEKRGVIPRLVWNIFQAIEEADSELEFTVKLSYVEIYNEKVKDLLDPKTEALKIRESPEGVYIQGVTENYVSSYEQVLHLMEAGQSLRAIGSTNMNSQSSRSHSVFILTLGQKNKTSGSVKGSKLTLVDLAGSEKVRKTGATGQTMVEAQNINKSLAALGNVINALTSGTAAHIPYRDSKLTRLLSDSLGGNSKTVLIITASPADSESEETLSTCRFGTRAKCIKNNAKVNEDLSAAEYKRMWEQALETTQAHVVTITQLQNACNLLKECLGKNNIPLPEGLDKINSVIEKQQSAAPAAAAAVTPPVYNSDDEEEVVAQVVNIVDDRRTTTQISSASLPAETPSATPGEQANQTKQVEEQPNQAGPKVILSPLSPDMRKPPPPPPSTPRVPPPNRPASLTPSTTAVSEEDKTPRGEGSDGSDLVPTKLMSEMSGAQENGSKLPSDSNVQENASKGDNGQQTSGIQSAASEAERIKILEEKLRASDEMCKALLESSNYWRQIRLAQEKASHAGAPSSSKIAVVLAGGGGRARNKEEAARKNKVAVLSPFSVAAVDSRPRSPAARNRSPTARTRSPTSRVSSAAS